MSIASVKKVKAVPKLMTFQLEHSSACAQLRTIRPLDWVEAHSDWEFQYAVVKNKDGDADFSIDCDFNNIDVALFQRHFDVDIANQILRQLLKRGIPIIYENDDDFFNLPKDHAQYQLINDKRNNLLKLLNHSSVVTVTNQELAEVYAPHCRRVEIIPNGIDPTLWTNPQRHSTADKVVLCWAGTQTHAKDIALIEEALLRLFDEYGDAVELLMWGWMPESLRNHPQVKGLEFTGLYEEYAKQAQDVLVDIAVIPLLDNEFNRRKSAIKWKEFSFGAVAGVYSNLPSYKRVVEDGVTGLLAEATTDSWYQAIKKLTDDKSLRLRLGEAARNKAVKEYSIEVVGKRWLEVLNSLKLSQQDRPYEDEPFASIIIPVFNRADLTEQCLKRLQENTAEVDHEVIVVNNASSDGTDELLKLFQPGIRVISNTENLGFSKANNQAAKVAIGNVLVMLNNDTEVQQGWLKALVDCQMQTGAELIGSRLTYPDGSIQHAGVAIYPQDNKPHALYAGLPPDSPAFEAVTSSRREFQIVTAACWLVDAECWSHMSGFDEGYVNGYEDVDFCLRLRETGGRIVYEPSARIIHHESKSPGRATHSDHNAQRLFSRWQGQWVPDLDCYLHEDGLQMNERFEINSRDQQILLNNIKSLEQHHPTLAQQIWQLKAGARRLQYTVIEGGKSLVIDTEAGNITLHSKRAPEKEAERIATTCLETLTDNTARVIGFAMGWHISAVLEKMNPEQYLEVLIVDALVFRLALENIDLVATLSDKRLKFVDSFSKGEAFILPAYRPLLQKK